MKTRELKALGIPDGHSLDLAVEFVRRLGKAKRNRTARAGLRERLALVAKSPEAFS